MYTARMSGIPQKSASPPAPDPLDGQEFARIPLSNSPWRDVLHLGRAVDYTCGEVVIAEFTPPLFLYFLDQGEVRMLRSDPQGLEKTLWYVDEGHLFGETPLLDGRLSRNRHVCTQDARIHLFRREIVLHTILPARPDLAHNLMETLACKVRILSNQIAGLTLEELPARICNYLYLHARRLGPDDQNVMGLDPRLNQQELANLLGVHRVTLNKALRDLKQAGVLDGYRKDKVRIHNPALFLKYARS